MTTDPRSLREALAFEGIKHPERLHDQARRLLFEAADRNLAALRAALAANPRLIEELLPAGYAEAASIVRALAKADPTWRERYMGRDGFVCTLCSSASIQQPDCPHVRAVEWATEHPESE